MKYLIPILLAFSPLVLEGQSSFPDLLIPAIDSIFQDWDRSDSPGCAIGIFQKGKIVYARGYGMANLEYDIPNDERSVFRIGSTSKQFTAACVVLLAEQGKLKLDDPIKKYFPELPKYADPIQIVHLLNHTSGMRDYLVLAMVKGYGDDDWYSDEELMQWLVNQRELNFPPGSEFLYSNSGYWLLGQLVERVSGQNMADFAEEQIFAPLGMENTHFHNDHTRIVPRRASGYAPDGNGGYRISMTTLNMIGDGGIFTSIEDAKKWDDEYYQRKILGDTFWETMTSRGTLNSGDTLDYAAGVFVDKYRGLPTIRHGGAFVGFRAELLRFPEQKTSIAIFANRADANPPARANQVADLILAEYFAPSLKKKEAAVPEEVIQLPTSTLEAYVGSYKLDAEKVLQVTLKNDTLRMMQMWNETTYPIFATSVHTFITDSGLPMKFIFTQMQAGQAQELQVDRKGQKYRCKRISPFKSISPDITPYLGSYFSQEIGANYELVDQDGKIQVQIDGKDRTVLTAIEQDQFTGRGMTFHFERSGDKVDGFRLDVGRVKNLLFVRQ